MIRNELAKAYDIHPGYLMPSAVTGALEDAGFRIMSQADLDGEIALAYQAGVDSVREA